MQIPPLNFNDLSLLLAIGSIVLLITAFLTSPYSGLKNLKIFWKKIRTAAMIAGILFLITVSFRIAVIILLQVHLKN